MPRKQPSAPAWAQYILSRLKADKGASLPEDAPAGTKVTMTFDGTLVGDSPHFDGYVVCRASDRAIGTLAIDRSCVRVRK